VEYVLKIPAVTDLVTLVDCDDQKRCHHETSQWQSWYWKVGVPDGVLKNTSCLFHHNDEAAQGCQGERRRTKSKRSPMEGHN
jgi:hypothetical protein